MMTDRQKIDYLLDRVPPYMLGEMLARIEKIIAENDDFQGQQYENYQHEPTNE